MDVIIPIVFPDYLIGVNTPEIKVDVPDWLDDTGLFPDTVTVPSTQNKVPELGHAGILFINGASGLTKYYEYGRYDRANKGLTRRVAIPDARIVNGTIHEVTLKKVLKSIAFKSGQRGRISGVHIEVENQFDNMLNAAQARVKENRDANRDEYSLLGNSCVHFMKEIIEAAGVDTPYMIDPRPNSYIEELRSDFPKLDYYPALDRLQIVK